MSVVRHRGYSRGVTRSGRVYTPWAVRAAGVAGQVARYGVKKLGQYATRKMQGKKSGGVKETGVTFGSMQTFNTSYRKKRTSRRRAKGGRAKKNKFIYQLAALQNPTQSVSSTSFAISSTVGIQQWYSLDFLKGNDVRALLNQNIPAGSSFALQQDQRLFLKSFVLTVNLQNTGLTPAIIEIYTLMPREDLDDADIPETGVMGNDLQRFITSTMGVVGTPGTNVLADAAGDSIPSSQTLGVTPFMMPPIVRRFVIMKAQKLMLPGGGTFSMSLNLKPSKPLDAADWVGLHYKRGISKALLFRVQGFPTVAQLADATTNYLQFTENQSSKVINIKQSAQANAGGA